MTESVHLSTAGTGAEYVAPDATVTVKVGSEHTGAQYEIFEVDAPRGPASPPHSESWSKAFYMLQGRILVQAGDQGLRPRPRVVDQHPGRDGQHVLGADAVREVPRRQPDREDE
jgi:hypothetical protein